MSSTIRTYAAPHREEHGGTNSLRDVILGGGLRLRPVESSHIMRTAVVIGLGAAAIGSVVGRLFHGAGA